ncbi:MAG: TonB-dependent receptor [Phenylobacterium sp.]|uniref:TonB-dependent siderophore receptor n=1 Tax=Phenylobacterium sp. TaxID=1871053 RepID=UPI001A42EC47|nr:TonB-dependent receptor [Phenylobacterium sp.]MBL8773328.1 TonB-dependent receptor [Phenylobacterium sp.]
MRASPGPPAAAVIVASARAKGRRRVAAWAGAAALAFASGAAAQRVSENAVTSAEDAFGNSVGRETIGLYSSSSVRGFSAFAAGNARIDGLFFDPVWNPTPRIRRSTSIRVGLSAQGFPFPAPTGVVDYALKRPGAARALSAYATVDTYGTAALEIDAETPLHETLSLAGGFSLNRNAFFNDTEGLQHVEGLIASWRPRPGIEIRPFWARSDIYDDEFGPTYAPAGAFLPTRRTRREFEGPQQPKYRSTAHLYGVLADAAPAQDWRVRAGLFRTAFDDQRTATNLLLNLQPDGRADQILIVDPPSKLASTSGELRVSRAVAEGPRLHVLHLNLRARDRRDRYGGSDVVDLGPTVVGRPVAPLEGPFDFGPQTFDRVRQWTGGLAYEGRWRGRGEISLGVQKTDYRKTVDQPGLPRAVSETSPWLYSLAGAAYLSDSLALYAGYTRGLEETGVAPDNAANRNEALPAIRTRQRDAGLRWTIRPDLKLVAGVFEVEKPYFNLNERQVFTALGDVRHRGVEASLSGKLTPRVDVVAGGVFMWPRVTGEGVALGRVGRRPVGQPTRNLQLNVDWRPPGLENLSLDLGATHLSRRPATRSNDVFLPSRTLVDLGARYRFEAHGRDASLRLRVTNLFNVHGWDLRGAGAYDLIPGRVASVALAVDF